MQRNLAAALGSNEVTPIELAGAYAMLVNGGKQIEPVLVERIQDRHGRTIMRADPRSCDGCQVVTWNGAPPPADAEHRAQVVSTRATPTRSSRCSRAWSSAARPRTRWCSASRWPARPAPPTTARTPGSSASRPISWSAVFVGFDQPRRMGKRATGATVALPIWIEVMQEALEGQAGDAVPHPARAQPRAGRTPTTGPPRAAAAANRDRRGFPPRHRARAETASDGRPESARPRTRSPSRAPQPARRRRRPAASTEPRAIDHHHQLHEGTSMRAEIANLASPIKEGLELQRRHL